MLTSDYLNTQYLGGTKILNKKYFLIVLAITLIFSKAILAIDGGSSKLAKERASILAQHQWSSQIKIDYEEPFYNQNSEIVAYMFAVHKNSDLMPSKSTIRSKIAKARIERIKAEQEYLEAKSIMDKNSMAIALQEIESAWSEMRDEKNFGTVIMSAKPPYMPIEMYDGLPLHFVSLPDAIDKAIDSFASKQIGNPKFVFTGLFGYYAVFENGKEKHWVNLRTFGDDENIPFPDKGKLSAFEKTRNYPTNLKASFAPENPPLQYKINGVPDYQSTYRHCAEYAAADILGYYDDRGYPELVKGGDSSLEGDRQCWNLNESCQCGYHFLAYCELAEAMDFNYKKYGGTLPCKIDDGIIAVCNYAKYKRNYNFRSYQYGYDSPENQYSFIRSEIRMQGRPLEYTLSYHLYGGGDGLHSVALIGYGCDLIDTFWGKSNPQKQSLTAQEAWYYLCHDDNSSTGKNVKLYWTGFTQALIHTVIPGGGLGASAEKSVPGMLKNLKNYPNPFNPKTNIYFELAKSAKVLLKIYNVTGKQIDIFDLGALEAGRHNFEWNGGKKNHLASGIYIYEIQAGNSRQLGRMLFVK